MINPEKYISELVSELKAVLGARLLYVGLQGSYMREEATEDSDLDVMVVIENMTVKDLDTYREIISSLGDYEKACGFISGREELSNWNPLEICHLIHTTRDYYGTLTELVPQYSKEDVRNFVKISINNLYHEICHRYVHSSKDENIKCIPFSYKSVFFILQNLYFLKNGTFINSKKELIELLQGRDRLVLETLISFDRGETFDFDCIFDQLLNWCKEIITRV